jgi:hypothetical protein
LDQRIVGHRYQGVSMSGKNPVIVM